MLTVGTLNRNWEYYKINQILVMQFILTMLCWPILFNLFSIQLSNYWQLFSEYIIIITATNFTS